MIVVLATALILFTGCKKQVQKEFSGELAKQSEMNAGEYSLEIDHLSIEAENADASTKAQMDMIAKMITGTKISGSYQLDSKEELLSMDMNVEALGQEIPLEFLMNQREGSFYVNTNFMAKAMELAKEFTAEIPIEESNIEALEGKYIQITDEDVKENVADQVTTDRMNDNLNSKLFSDYINTLDSDSFERKGDTITRTFTKEDMKGFVNYVNVHGDKAEKKEAKELKKNLNLLTEFKQKMVVDTNKHTQKATINFSVKNEGVTASATVKADNRAKESKKKLQLPKKNQVVTMKELEETMSSVQEQNTTVSEKDFNELLEGIRSGEAEFTQERMEQIRKGYKPYLSEEQYKQLEDALDQALQEAA